MEARRAAAIACAGAFALGIAACGGGERQDANEPSGTYKVKVVKAIFPQRQSLAKRSALVITVKNLDSKTIPDIAVTVDGFSQRLKDPTLADPERPQFVINGVSKRIGDFPESKEASPQGTQTAYVGTWTLGKMSPGEEKTFRWSVTAVKGGPYRLKYEVAAGLDGKAKAVDSAGTRPTGVFIGTVTTKAPDTRVADDGTTVIEGTR